MQQDDNINGVEIQFVPITKRSKLTMDDLIGGEQITTIQLESKLETEISLVATLR